MRVFTTKERQMCVCVRVCVNWSGGLHVDVDHNTTWQLPEQNASVARRSGHSTAHSLFIGREDQTQDGFTRSAANKSLFVFCIAGCNFRQTTKTRRTEQIDTIFIQAPVLLGFSYFSPAETHSCANVHYRMSLRDLQLVYNLALISVVLVMIKWWKLCPQLTDLETQ